MQKDWEEQNNPDTTPDLKNIQGKLNTPLLMTEPSYEKPGTSALLQASKSTTLFLIWGSADVTTLWKSSCSISSVLANRLIACLYVKAKERQLKQGFVQLGATVIFTFRNAKGCGHSTAKERKHHIHSVALGTRQCINTLKRSGAIGIICRVQIQNPKISGAAAFFSFLTTHFLRDFQEKSVTCRRQCSVSRVSEAAWGQCPIALCFTLPVVLGTCNNAGWELLSAPHQGGPECLSHVHPLHNLLLWWATSSAAPGLAFCLFYRCCFLAITPPFYASPQKTFCSCWGSSWVSWGKAECF